MARTPLRTLRVCRGLGWTLAALVFAAEMLAQSRPTPFTLQQALSAPYATDLTPCPAPGSPLFAWVEDAEGCHNLWIGDGRSPARSLTHNTEDDAQDIADLAWSPDCRQIGYTFGATVGAGGQPANPAHLQRPTPLRVIVQPLAPGAAPIVIGEGRSLLFLPDRPTGKAPTSSRSVIFLRNGQIWTAPLDGSAPPHQLVFDRGSASQLAVSSGGSSQIFIAYISTRRTEGHLHSFLAVFNTRSSTLRFPGASTGSDLSPVFVDGDSSLAWLRRPFSEPPDYAPNRVAANPWSIQMLQLIPRYDETRSYPDDYEWPVRTVYTAPPNRPGSVLPHMSTGEPKVLFPDPDSLVFSSEADGWNHLYLLKWRTSEPPRLLTPGPFEVEDPVIDHFDHVVYYSANNPAAPAAAGGDPLDADRRHVFRLNFQPDAPFPYMVPQRITRGRGIETHPHLSFPGIATLASSVSEPMHPALWDDRTGESHAFRPDRLPADYPGASFVTPKQVLLRSTEGIRLHAQLFEPATPLPTGHRRPAILFFHGGPNRQMMLGFPPMDYYSDAYAMNQYLASRGFVVVSVNYRCGIGYGLNFRQCLHAGPGGAREYNDVLAAAAWLRARPDIDPKRIGIWGGSYGGYFVALALARNSNLFAAGVDFHGVHEWRPGTFEPEDWLHGSSDDPYLKLQARRRALAHHSSPMADIAHWRSPVLLIHGDDDSHVAYNQTPMLADALRARGVPVEELIFPDEQHGFLLHRDWVRAYEATAEFFERKLQPER